MLAVLSA